MIKLRVAKSQALARTKHQNEQCESDKCRTLDVRHKVVGLEDAFER